MATRAFHSSVRESGLVVIRVKRPAICALRTGEQAGLLDLDAGVDECGWDAFGDVLEGVGDLGAAAGGQRQSCGSRRRSRPTPGRRRRRRRQLSTMSIMFARAVMGMPRNRANSAATMRGVATGGTVMSRTGIRSVTPGWRAESMAWWVLPNWVMAVVVPVPAAPARHR